MGKKNKKRAGKKSRGGQKPDVYFLAKSLKLSTHLAIQAVGNNGRITSTNADLPKSVQDYFLVHPKKNSATICEIADYLIATAKITEVSAATVHRDGISDAFSLSPPQLKADQIDTAHAPSSERVDRNLSAVAKASSPPVFGERILLLILTKEERVNIPGDLEEEFRGIAAKHSARYAKLWYYKQVAASAWPIMRKAVGWGLLTSIGAWLRRII